MQSKNLLDLEHKLNYYFNDRNLLKNALIHRSYSNENKKYKKINNEKLELLGDSVLSLIVIEYLLQKFPNETEGNISKIKAMSVSEPVLAKVSRAMNVGEFLLMSKGEQLNGGKDRDSILADAFEAILGAIYLDSNFKDAQTYVLYHLKNYIDNIENDEDIIDYKTILQEYTQKKYKKVPEYRKLSESGPDHLKHFEIEVRVDKYSGIGVANSKKRAEQVAARDLYKKLEKKNNEAL